MAIIADTPDQRKYIGGIKIVEQTIKDKDGKDKLTKIGVPNGPARSHFGSKSFTTTNELKARRKRERMNRKAGR